MKKKALIFGISGQDGIILSDHLLKKKYNVYGYIRNKNKKKYLNKKIKLFFNKKLTEKFILSIIKKTNPSEIYFLIGQSSSYISFKKPSETFETNFIYFSYIYRESSVNNYSIMWLLMYKKVTFVVIEIKLSFKHSCYVC